MFDLATVLSEAVAVATKTAAELNKDIQTLVKSLDKVNYQLRIACKHNKQDKQVKFAEKKKMLQAQLKDAQYAYAQKVRG
jgi:hypothetical protein